jgi:hypothetical protein
MITRRPKLLSIATICAMMLCLLNPGKALADLMDGVWTLTSHDDHGINWTGSKLHFLTDTPTTDARALTGYFEWTSDIGAFGRENFTGTINPDRHLVLDGTQIVPPASLIVLAHYEADLTVAGNELINGTWTGNVIPGAWTAVLSPVPEPGTYAMFLAGLGLLGWRLRNTNS